MTVGEPGASIERVFREEYGALLASLARLTAGDLLRAEDALADAFAAAAEQWRTDGVPERAGAWLFAVARRRLVDGARRVASSRAVELDDDHPAPPTPAADPDDPVHALTIAPEDFPCPDDRLRLVFTCCHPALAPEARVALTLNTLGGLRTRQIARAFLVAEPTMAQRLVRAKTKIRAARIPYRVPPEGVVRERLAAVLRVVYLIHTEGSAVGDEPTLERDGLRREARRLARLLVELLPDDGEVVGLLALLLLHDARRMARVSEDGELVLLADQDRSLWDRERIDEGRASVERALRSGPPGPYALQAAIAAVHADAPDAAATDWPQIVALYDLLLAAEPTPVVALNRAVAVAERDGAEAGLALVDALAADGALADYLYLHATRADLLRRLGRAPEAAAAYRRAIELADRPLERRFLVRRLAEVGG